MPTKRNRRTRVVTKRRVTPGERNYLFTGDSAGDPEVFLDLECNGGDRELWKSAREELLRDFIREFPGRRPWAWWKFDSPGPRLRLGGRGEARFPHNLHFGIPLPYYYEKWLVDIFRHRNPGGVREYDIFDPSDPPVYESQESYLRRNGLLLPDEEKRLLAELGPRP